MTGCTGGVLLAALATGCAQLAGIEETSGPGASGLNLTVERVSVGATIVRGPEDLRGHEARWLVPDATAPGGTRPIVGTFVPPNAWHADGDGVTPPVLFDLSDQPLPHQRLYDLANANITMAIPVLEHPDPVPPPDGATIAVDVSLDVAYSNESFQLYTVGAWGVLALPSPAVGATQLTTGPLPYANTAAPSGGPLAQITTDDVVTVLRYIGSRLAGVGSVAPFEQTASETLAATMTTVPLDQTLDARIDQAAIATRLASVRPTLGTPSQRWTLRAAPGHALGLEDGPLLHMRSVPATDPATVTVSYGNPFAARDWQTLLVWSGSASRTYTVPAFNVGVTLSALMLQRAVPTPGIELALPAGLPVLVTVAGTPLQTDGLTITAPTSPVEITMTTDRVENTLYQIELIELVPDVPPPSTTTVALVPVLTALAVQPTFTVPPDLFKPGSHYTIRATALLGGFPGLATGDLATVELPVARAMLESGVFQVTP